MKTTIFGIVLIAATFSGCGSNTEKKETNAKSADTNQATTSSVEPPQEKPRAANEVVTGYLHMKNALVSDNGKDAAEAGKEITAAMQKIDETSLSAEQKKVYEDVKDDIREHAEHISTNSDKIAHQREHFDMLSKDMYDLVKTLNTGQTLYKDHCPMYNDGKGANWLSEVKEIKNPYLGKKMLTCGTVKEELK